MQSVKQRIDKGRPLYDTTRKSIHGLAKMRVALFVPKPDWQALVELNELSVDSEDKFGYKIQPWDLDKFPSKVYIDDDQDCTLVSLFLQSFESLNELPSFEGELELITRRSRSVSKDDEELEEKKIDDGKSNVTECIAQHIPHIRSEWAKHIQSIRWPTRTPEIDWSVMINPIWSLMMSKHCLIDCNSASSFHTQVLDFLKKYALASMPFIELTKNLFSFLDELLQKYETLKSGVTYNNCFDPPLDIAPVRCPVFDLEQCATHAFYMNYCDEYSTQAFADEDLFDPLIRKWLSVQRRQKVC